MNAKIYTFLIILLTLTLTACGGGGGGSGGNDPGATSCVLGAGALDNCTLE